jgi:hypothetical protein
LLLQSIAASEGGGLPQPYALYPADDVQPGPARTLPESPPPPPLPVPPPPAADEEGRGAGEAGLYAGEDGPGQSRPAESGPAAGVQAAGGERELNPAAAGGEEDVQQVALDSA